MVQLVVVAHGSLQGGGSRRHWARAERRLRSLAGGGVEVRFTAGPGDATRIARQALLEGHRWLAAAGGDGTVHEVVNAFFEGDRNIRPDACLSVLPCGSGNDWARTMDCPASLVDAAGQLERITQRRIDVGHARFCSHDGSMRERAFINFAEAGVGAVVISTRSRRHGGMRGPLGYWPAAFRAAMAYRPRNIQLKCDGNIPVDVGPVLSLIVANGRFIGAGMQCAPMARPDDGLFEAITLGNFSRLEILWKIGKFFSGRYLGEAKATHRSVRELEARSEDSVPLELDGELVGRLPLAVRVLPSALSLRP